jgi:hypothetical protein
MPARKFASPDRAPWLLSDRIYLHDKTADVPWSRGHSFTNHARIAVNRFTAEFQADVTRPAHRQAAFIGKPYINRSFATSEDITAAKRAYEALRLSKPARDRYFIDTQTRRRATFGDRIIMDGSFRFGQQVRKTL